MMNPTRREALFAPLAMAIAEEKPPIIDTHTHFYDPKRPEGVPWPGKGDKVLYRPVLPAEFKKLAAPHGVTGTVVVEASPRIEDNQWLLDIATNEPFLTGIVGRLAPDDAKFTQHLERFAKNPRFRGIRWNEAETREGLKNPAARGRLQALSDTGLTLDLNGGPDVHHVAVAVAEKFPKLRIVINHMGNPRMDGKPPTDAWLKAIRASSAAGKTVWCKLSALVDGTGRTGGKAPTDAAFYRPAFDALWDAFGENRLMYGSNWPVSDLYATYATVFDLASGFVKPKGAAAFAKVFGANAKVAYGLK
ncbi:MAG: amidohydrolase family protein [Gemmataceae bacterium]